MEHPVPMLSDPRHRRLWDALDSAIPASKRRRSSDAQAMKAAEEALSMDPPDGPLTARASEVVLARAPDRFDELVMSAVHRMQGGAGDLVSVAWVLLERGDHRRASEILDAMGDGGRLAEVTAARGVCAYLAGSSDAFDLLVRAWELDPDEPRIYPGLSQLDPDAGWEQIECMQALHRGERLPDVCPAGGRYSELYDCCVMWADGLRDEALGAVSGSDLCREDAFCKVVYARMCANRGLYPKAAEAYREALEAEPGWLFAVAEEATVLRKSGDRASAMDICRTALESDPGNRTVLEAMIASALDAGRKHEADLAVSALVSVRPEDARDYAYAAGRLDSAGFPADATALVKRMALRCADQGYGELQLAVRANADGDARSALAHATKALKAMPGDVDALCEKARALLTLGKVRKAAEAADRASAADPSDIRPLAVRRDILVAEGESERALELYDAMVSEHPGSSGLRRGRAELLASMGRRDEALEGYREALNAKEDSRLFITIITSLLADRDIDSLCRFVDDYDDIYGMLPEVWMIRGNAEYADGRYDDAAGSYARVAALAPNDPAVWYSKGLSEMRSGSLLAAQSSFDRAIILDLENPEYWTSKALVQEELDDVKGAVKSVNRVISMAPDDPEPLVMKARLLVRAGMYGEALAFLDKALRMRPGDLDMLTMQKDICRHTGDSEHAADLCTRILAADRWRPDAAVDLAFVNAETGKADDGRRLIDDLCRHAPDSREALRGRALFYSRYATLDEAIGAYEVLIGAFPDDRESAEELSALYISSGEGDRAETLMSRFREPEPAIVHDVPDAPSMDEVRDALSSGDDARAVTLLRAAVDSGTEDPEVYIMLSGLMLDAGNLQEALYAAERGRYVAPSDPGMLRVLARSQLACGDGISALGSFNGAVAAGAADAPLMIEKGDLEFELGLYRPSADSYLAAMRTDPDSRDAAMGLCRVHMRLGDRDRAGPLLDGIISRHPDDEEALMMRAEIYSWHRDAEGLLSLYDMIRDSVGDPDDLMSYASALRDVGEGARADSLFGIGTVGSTEPAPDGPAEAVQAEEPPPDEVPEPPAEEEWEAVDAPDEVRVVPTREEVEAAAERLFGAAPPGRRVDDPSVYRPAGIPAETAERAYAYLCVPERYPFINPGDDFFEEMEDGSFKVIVGSGLTGIEASPAVPVEAISAVMPDLGFAEVRRLQAYINFALTADEDPIAFSKEVEAVADAIRGTDAGVFTVMDRYGVGVYTARTAKMLSQ